jgi:hypothetical protein
MSLTDIFSNQYRFKLVGENTNHRQLLTKNELPFSVTERSRSIANGKRKEIFKQKKSFEIVFILVLRILIL